MKKRRKLGETVATVERVRDKQAERPATASETRTCGVHLPVAVHDQLKRLALLRSYVTGQRLSVSRTIVDILARYAHEYEKTLDAERDDTE